MTVRGAVVSINTNKRIDDFIKCSIDQSKSKPIKGVAVAVHTKTQVGTNAISDFLPNVIFEPVSFNPDFRWWCRPG